VLVYQHFGREERRRFVERLAGEMARRTGADAVLSYRTPRVVFLLAAQATHARIFRAQAAPIVARWGRREIVPEEHTPAADERPEASGA
jgi:hypothetical protein